MKQINCFIPFRDESQVSQTVANLKSQKEVNEIITFVPEVAEAAKVEYFGLDGVAIQAPKAGQIAVKVTKNANGQRTIEKIRVK